MSDPNSNIYTTQVVNTYQHVPDGDPVEVQVYWDSVQIETYVDVNSKNYRKVIESNNTGDTITDSFFANPITAIATSNQFYIIDENFTQNTTAQSITGINLSFYLGQKLIAYI